MFRYPLLSKDQLLKKDQRFTWNNLLFCAFFIAISNLALAQTSAESTQPTSPQLSASEIDWVKWDDLTQDQQASVPDACCGLYIEPPIDTILDDPESTDIRAGNVSSNGDERINFSDHFEAIQDGAIIQGDSGSYNRDTEIFDIKGNISIRQPGMLLVGATATLNQATETSHLYDATYVLQQDGVRGSANIIIYTNDDGIVTIDNGLYTRCEPGDNSWVMAAKTIILDQAAGRGSARNVTLRIKDIPIFYMPYFSFPLDDQRASGFLAPSFGSSRDGGLDISIPYYFNIAPNLDATLTPRIISERGILVNLEGRHLGQSSSNVLSLTYLANDKLYNSNKIPQVNNDGPDVKDRWLVEYDFTSRLSNRWTTSIDYSAVSDEDYFQDLSNAGLHNTTLSYLYRLGNISYLTDNWQFNSYVQDFQIIDPTIPELSLPYQVLPSINLIADFQKESGLEYGFDAEYVFFTRNIKGNRLSQSQIDAGALLSGHRLSFEPVISWSWTTPGTFFRPTAKYKYASYQLDEQALNTSDHPDRGIFMGSLDGGLLFERDIDFSDKSYSQTLEPRLYYLYSEYEDQSDIPIFDSANMTFGFNQLFREDRFSGKDRVGDSNQLTAGLTSRFFDSSGREQAHASIGQIYYFKNRRVNLYNSPEQIDQPSSSAIASDLSYQFNADWRIASYMEYNIDAHSISVGSFQFRYQSDINHILNFSYRYYDVPNSINALGFDSKIDQTDISAIWPLAGNWGLIGRWNYDLANNRDLETIIGVEYSNCCWKMRIVAREWIDNDDLFLGGELEQNTGIFFQFELKGLGNILGGSVSSILGNAIAGYREHEYVE